MGELVYSFVTQSAPARVFARRLSRDIFCRMHQTQPLIDSDKLYQSLNLDLQRRIESIGRTTPETFGVLEAYEWVGLGLGGVVAPMALAWWLL